MNGQLVIFVLSIHWWFLWHIWYGTTL